MGKSSVEKMISKLFPSKTKMVEKSSKITT